MVLRTSVHFQHKVLAWEQQRVPCYASHILQHEKFQSTLQATCCIHFIAVFFEVRKSYLNLSLITFVTKLSIFLLSEVFKPACILSTPCWGCKSPTPSVALGKNWWRKCCHPQIFPQHEQVDVVKEAMAGGPEITLYFYFGSDVTVSFFVINHLSSLTQNVSSSWMYYN